MLYKVDYALSGQIGPHDYIRDWKSERYAAGEEKLARVRFAEIRETLQPGGIVILSADRIEELGVFHDDSLEFLDRAEVEAIEQ